jgi:hypothetical protein
MMLSTVEKMNLVILLILSNITYDARVNTALDVAD